MGEPNGIITNENLSATHYDLQDDNVRLCAVNNSVYITEASNAAT
jgi:hypothetical protein